MPRRLIKQISLKGTDMADVDIAPGVPGIIGRLHPDHTLGAGPQQRLSRRCAPPRLLDDPTADAEHLALFKQGVAIVPDLPSVPVQPIILATQEEPGMFDFYRNFLSFLNVHRYASQEQLIAELGEKVIRPAELKVLDLQGRDLRPQA